MKHHIFVAFLIFIGVYAKQGEACPAQPVLNRCLEDMKARANLCDKANYNCLCGAYRVIAICYNNCPEDGGRAVAQKEALDYCAKASENTSGTGITSSSVAPITTTSTSLPATTRQPTTSATRTSTGAAEAHSGSVHGALIAAGLAVALL